MKNLKKNNIHSRTDFEKLVREGKPDPQADDFERDALEGWQRSGSSFDLLKKPDRRFLKRPDTLWLAALFIPVFILIYIGMNFSTEKTAGKDMQKSGTEKSYIEKTDLETPEKIDRLKPIAPKKIILAKTLQENFQSKQEQPETHSDPPGEEGPVTELKPKEPEEIKENRFAHTEQLSSKAAEMYIHDLLVVDYRKYRSRPVIKTEQVIITGTSADMESRESRIEDTDWKQVEIPYIDYISKTMGVFSKGNYKKALTRYLEILKTYPDDLNASFYGALCYYNLGEFEKAYGLFSDCKTHKFTNFHEESAWYGAKSLLAMEETEKAKKQLEEIVRARGFYSEKAKTELERLQKK